MLIFFFIALLVNFGKTVTPDEEVRQMLAELEIVSGPTMDVASTLKKVTKVSMPFLQDIHSVSNLAAAGMSLQGETGPKVRKRKSQNTAEMDLNIERLRNSMNYDQSLREYGNVVTLNLDIIEPTLLRVINPEEDPPIWRDDFIEEKVENDDESFRSSFMEYKQNMIVALTSMSVKMANQKMARLRTLLLEPKNPEPKERMCLPKEAIETNQYKRDSLVNTIELVRRDIARLEMIAGMCANVSSAGSENKMIKMFDEINALVVGMSNKMEKWLKRKLELAWPNVILSHAKERYGKYSHLSKYQLNVTARSVLFSANERGPPEYVDEMTLSNNVELKISKKF
ncbi:hypothetical protein GPALN_002329 [Globodera pallida]|nr:hypothetical protein GPALN_002329 [Globodera pallida]